MADRTGILSPRFAAACAASLAVGAALQTPMPAPHPRPTAAQAQETVMPDPQHERIDEWIARNNLNPYGDSKDTMYFGGTPLFDERTGVTEDRYSYILRRHPELKQNGPGTR
jgi:hypothetical protein